MDRLETKKRGRRPNESVTFDSTKLNSEERRAPIILFSFLKRDALLAPSLASLYPRLALPFGRQSARFLRTSLTLFFGPATSAESREGELASLSCLRYSFLIFLQLRSRCALVCALNRGNRPSTIRLISTSSFALSTKKSAPACMHFFR